MCYVLMNHYVLSLQLLQLFVNICTVSWYLYCTDNAISLTTMHCHSYFSVLVTSWGPDIWQQIQLLRPFHLIHLYYWPYGTLTLWLCQYFLADLVCMSGLQHKFLCGTVCTKYTHKNECRMFVLCFVVPSFR